MPRKHQPNQKRKKQFNPKKRSHPNGKFAFVASSSAESERTIDFYFLFHCRRRLQTHNNASISYRCAESDTLCVESFPIISIRLMILSIYVSQIISCSLVLYSFGARLTVCGKLLLYEFFRYQRIDFECY